VLAAGELEVYRAAVAPLAAEFDLLDLAAAALKLAHGNVSQRPVERGRSDVVKVPDPLVGAQGAAAASVDAMTTTDGDEPAADTAPPKNRGERRAAARAAVGMPLSPSPHPEPPVAARPRPSRPTRPPPTPAMAHLRIALGKQGGLRPADIVGAIANETGLAARSIGSITIGERSATVEVPATEADAIVRALSGTTIRGRKVRVDRRE
jgi:ATP-dependent RNA helicase DeaD